MKILTIIDNDKNEEVIHNVEQWTIYGPEMVIDVYGKPYLVRHLKDMSSYFAKVEPVVEIVAEA